MQLLKAYRLLYDMGPPQQQPAPVAVAAPPPVPALPALQPAAQPAAKPAIKPAASTRAVPGLSPVKALQPAVKK